MRGPDEELIPGQRINDTEAYGELPMETSDPGVAIRRIWLESKYAPVRIAYLKGLPARCDQCYQCGRGCK